MLPNVVRKLVLWLALSMSVALPLWLTDGGNPLNWTLRGARADDDDRGFDDQDDRSSGSNDRTSADNARPPAEPRNPEDAQNLRERGIDLDHERHEVLAAGLTAQQLSTLQQDGYGVIQQRNLDSLGQSVVRLRVPRGTTLSAAQAKIRGLSKSATVDLNHLYRVNDAACSHPRCDHLKLVAWPDRTSACNKTVVIGMIDTAVETKHALLHKQNLEVHVVRGSGRAASSSMHGTAVASVMVGAADSAAPGIVPSATLIAADAFHRGEQGDDRMDAFDLVAAIDVLLKRAVRVLNLSFAGPANALLEQSLKSAHERGVLLVAAVGNDGPQSPPRFPAAYAHVLGVTAIGKDLQQYRRAVQGKHVALAAPGVDIPTADSGDKKRINSKSGTSFAAPHVSAAAAIVYAQMGGTSPEAVTKQLLRATKDLGAPGFDPIFGHGLLQVQPLCKP